MTQSKRNSVFVLTVFEVSLLSIVFDLSLTSPIHEFGHFFACLLLGVKVNSIGWGQIVFTSVSDWRQNLIGYSGGLFAAVFLSCLFVLLGFGFSRFHPQTMKGTVLTNYFSLLVKSIILTDLMVQLTGASFEGTNLPFYLSFIKNFMILYLLTLIFSGVSFLAMTRVTKQRIATAV